MTLKSELTYLFPPYNLSAHDKNEVHALITHLASLLIGSFAHQWLYHFFSSAIRMTGWKDSRDSWIDSKLPRRLTAVTISRKSLKNLSTGSQYVFSNNKLLGPARLTHTAGTTPQSQYKLTATALRQWSKCFSQIYFFNFFCPTKALQIKTTGNRQIYPDDFHYFVTELSNLFWKELVMFFRLLYGTFCFTKVRCCMVVCYIWPDLHHRVVSSTAPSFDGVPNFHFFEMDVLYAFKAFLNEFSGVLILKTLSPSAMSALPLFHFHF